MVVERRLYVKRGEILVEKISKKNIHTYKRVERGKTYPITQETYNVRATTFYNELATIKPIDEKLEKRFDKRLEEQKEVYEEYEYFIGFDYETPILKSGEHTLYGSKGKHDFKTEFRVSSPLPLSDSEIKSVIQSKFRDYGVLKNNDSYEIKSDSHKPSKKRVDITAKFTEKITR